MGGSESDQHAGTADGRLRELELELAKAKLEAETLRLKARQLELEAELERVKQQGAETGTPLSGGADEPEPKLPSADSPSAKGAANLPASASPSREGNSRQPASRKERPDPKPGAERAKHGASAVQAKPQQVGVQAVEAGARLTTGPARKPGPSAKPREKPKGPPPVPAGERSKGSQPSADGKPAKKDAAKAEPAKVEPAGEVHPDDRDLPVKKPAPAPAASAAAAAVAATAGASAAVAEKPKGPPPVPEGASAAVIPLESDVPPEAPVTTPPVVVAEPADGAEPGEEDDEAAAAPRGGMFRGASSFLISTLLHMAIMIALALFTIAGSEDVQDLFLLASTSQNEEIEELDDLLQEVAIIEEDLERIQSLPTDVPDPGAAVFGETASDAPPSEVGTIAAADVGVMSEVAALFGEGGQGMAKMGDGTGGATFFGVKAGGNKFVFVVDGSLSMKRGKWEACVYELMSAIQRLKPEQRFYVILFAAKSYGMFAQPADRFQGPKIPDADKPLPFCVPANPENITKLRQWLATYTLELGTKPYESIKHAVEMNPDAIYFLSDGQFRDPTESYLKKNNRIESDFSSKMEPKCVVHTIGFFSQDGQEILSRISKDNGGTYRFVPPPANWKGPRGGPARPPGARPNRPGQPGKKKR